LKSSVIILLSILFLFSILLAFVFYQLADLNKSLAESVLRIPDSKTRDLMISEKLSEGKWIDHLNKADSLFVNASTWGLLLAGKIVKTPKRWADNPNHFIQDLLSRVEEGETIVLRDD
jgi:hypothetical protein